MAKKPKAKTVLIGLAVLAAIGALTPDNEPEETADKDPPAIVDEQNEPDKADAENLFDPRPAEVDTPAPPAEETATEQTQKPEQTSQPEPESEPSPTPETEPEPTPQESTPEPAHWEWLKNYNYVGSKESDKYHYPQCRWTREINKENLVHFDTEEDAAASNYVPCGSCQP